ncbi:hypothetical protein ILUMI_13753 [Ignelater luminosus]|uniref:Uncharacterized protein n=1 Tax=Ignelater luminosus TaxID=2038154 RepID=A0A8K0CRS4_IGNLU|nr:hypothetical protein ILUMI_13753 [Ignelater luminosus]
MGLHMRVVTQKKFMGYSVHVWLQSGFKAYEIFQLNPEVILNKPSNRLFEFSDNGQHVENVLQTFLKELEKPRQTKTETIVCRRAKKKVNVLPGRGITVEDLIFDWSPTPGPSTSSCAKQPQKNKKKTAKRKLSKIEVSEPNRIMLRSIMQKAVIVSEKPPCK